MPTILPGDKVYVPSMVIRLFDGSNAQDMLDAVAALYPNAVISASSNYPGASATLTVVTDLDPNNAPSTIPFSVGEGFNLVAGGSYPVASLADATGMTSLAEFVRDHAPAPALAVGYGSTPNILVGASATVTVPMVPALPDAGYNVAVALAGSAQLLGSLQILGHTVVSASAVDVTVKNNGLLALAGATVLVTALHNG